jgi:hypothetical protein
MSNKLIAADQYIKSISLTDQDTEAGYGEFASINSHKKYLPLQISMVLN